MQFLTRNTNQMNDYERKILTQIGTLYQEGKLTDEFMVSNLKQCEEYLNLKSISEYAKSIGKTPQGVRRYSNKNIIKICNFQMIKDND